MAKIPAIVLLTDFGVQDEYVGVMKGVIINHYPNARIIDLTHGISPQNICHGALVLKNSCQYFPEQTLFVCVVDPTVGSHRKIVYVRTKDYSFLAPDNGLLDLVLQDQKIVRLSEVTAVLSKSKNISTTFHGRDLFAPTAAFLARGGDEKKIGKKLKRLKRLKYPKVRCEKTKVFGEIIYFDHFGNAISNIGFKDAQGIAFKSATVKKHRLNVVNNYSEAKKLTALFNSSGLLEICLPNGSAKFSAKLKVGEKVILK